MKKTLIAILALASSAIFAEDASVCQVSARQRWPFSRVVDIDILLHGAKCRDSELTATYDGAAAPINLLAGLVEGSPTLTPGTNRLVWDPAAAGFGGAELAGFSVSAALIGHDARKFLVIDLKERSYAYYADDPDGNGWTDDKYKLRYIVFRRIPAGVYQLGYSAEQRARWARLGAKGNDPNSVMRTVTITRDYYIGIYMLTAGQSQAMEWHSTPGNNGVNGYYYGDWHVTSAVPYSKRPVEWRGDFGDRANGCTWPQNGHAVSMPPGVGASGSLVGRFRRLMENGNCNLPRNMVIDLPTEAQWEVAARAGTTTFYDGCGTLSDDAAAILEYQVAHSTNRTVDVGLMLPNAWGLYDTSGMVYEMTLNTVAGPSSGFAGDVQCWVEGQTLDPVGVAVAPDESICGVCCNCGWGCRDITWGALPSARRVYSSTTTEKVGARLAIHLAPLAR